MLDYTPKVQYCTAWQWTGTNVDELNAVCSESGDDEMDTEVRIDEDGHVTINQTWWGPFRMNVDDYIFSFPPHYAFEGPVTTVDRDHFCISTGQPDPATGGIKGWSATDLANKQIVLTP